MGNPVQEKAGSFVEILLPARKIRIVHGGPEKKSAVPEIRFRFVLSRSPLHSRNNRIFLQKPVGFGDTELFVTFPLLFAQMGKKGIDSMGHPFRSENADPVMSP